MLGGAVVLIRIRHAAAGVDDHRALGQETVGDADRLIELAAGVAAQIEHQALHALLGQRLERVAEILVGVLGEVGDADVAGLRDRS